jgi:hypothetical protein
MKTKLKTPKKGAAQRLRDLYQKLRNESRRPAEDKVNTPSHPEKKTARSSNDSGLDM